MAGATKKEEKLLTVQQFLDAVWAGTPVDYRRVRVPRSMNAFTRAWLPPKANVVLGPWLPPRFMQITRRSVAWEHLPQVQYELLGYLLSCHLVIEHYIDTYLKASYRLEWDAARLTFNQKVDLLSGLDLPEQWNVMPAIKHLNSLRNKISHNLAYKVGTKEVQPLTECLARISQGRIQPTNTKAILAEFTGLTCALFLGMISGIAPSRKKKRR